MKENILTDKIIEHSANRIEEAAHSLKQSVETAENARETVQKMASVVESNVSEGIQPDIRELRIWMSDIDKKADIRLKRIYYALWILISLNAIILIKLLIL